MNRLVAWACGAHAGIFQPSIHDQIYPPSKLKILGLFVVTFIIVFIAGCYYYIFGEGD